MPHFVKRGDAKTLRWDTGRDLTGVASARVIISTTPGAEPAIDRDGVIDSPATAGIVSLALTVADYGVGKLESGERASRRYFVEVELPDPVTHPDSSYERLFVEPDLG